MKVMKMSVAFSIDATVAEIHWRSALKHIKGSTLVR